MPTRAPAVGARQWGVEDSVEVFAVTMRQSCIV